ncbi:hypothetical protein ACNQ1X_01630 [Mycoplasma sp. SK341A]|uniref:hypothetical protein n=1 Tax=Mycoplasma sp. SK341A TaxID=3401679 RepID=UPI003AAF49FA
MKPKKLTNSILTTLALAGVTTPIAVLSVSASGELSTNAIKDFTIEKNLNDYVIPYGYNPLSREELHNFITDILSKEKVEALYNEAIANLDELMTKDEYKNKSNLKSLKDAMIKMQKNIVDGFKTEKGKKKPDSLALDDITNIQAILKYQAGDGKFREHYTDALRDRIQLLTQWKTFLKSFIQTSDVILGKNTDDFKHEIANLITFYKANKKYIPNMFISKVADESDFDFISYWIWGPNWSISNFHYQEFRKNDSNIAQLNKKLYELFNNDNYSDEQLNDFITEMSNLNMQSIINDQDGFIGKMKPGNDGNKWTTYDDNFNKYDNKVMRNLNLLSSIQIGMKRWYNMFYSILNNDQLKNNKQGIYQGLTDENDHDQIELYSNVISAMKNKLDFIQNIANKAAEKDFTSLNEYYVQVCANNASESSSTPWKDVSKDLVNVRNASDMLNIGWDLLIYNKLKQQEMKEVLSFFNSNNTEKLIYMSPDSRGKISSDIETAFTKSAAFNSNTDLNNFITKINGPKRDKRLKWKTGDIPFTSNTDTTSISAFVGSADLLGTFVSNSKEEVDFLYNTCYNLTLESETNQVNEAYDDLSKKINGAGLTEEQKKEAWNLFKNISDQAQYKENEKIITEIGEAKTDINDLDNKAKQLKKEQKYTFASTESKDKFNNGFDKESNTGSTMTDLKALWKLLTSERDEKDKLLKSLEAEIEQNKTAEKNKLIATTDEFNGVIDSDIINKIKEIAKNSDDKQVIQNLISEVKTFGDLLKEIKKRDESFTANEETVNYSESDSNTKDAYDNAHEELDKLKEQIDTKLNEISNETFNSEDTTKLVSSVNTALKTFDESENKLNGYATVINGLENLTDEQKALAIEAINKIENDEKKNEALDQIKEINENIAGLNEAIEKAQAAQKTTNYKFSDATYSESLDDNLNTLKEYLESLNQDPWNIEELKEGSDDAQTAIEDIDTNISDLDGDERLQSAIDEINDLENISQADKEKVIAEIKKAETYEEIEEKVNTTKQVDEIIGALKTNVEIGNVLINKLDTDTVSTDKNDLSEAIKSANKALENMPSVTEANQIAETLKSAVKQARDDIEKANEELNKAYDEYKTISPEGQRVYNITVEEKDNIANNGTLSQIDALSNKLKHYKTAAPLLNYLNSEDLNSAIPVQPSFKVLKDTTKAMFENLQFNDSQAIATAAAAQELNNAQIAALNNVYSFSHLNKGQKEALYNQIQAAKDAKAIDNIISLANHLDASMSQLASVAQTVDQNIKDPDKHYQYANPSQLEELKNDLATANSLEALDTGKAYQNNLPEEIDALREKLKALDEQVAQQANTNYQAAKDLMNYKQQAIDKINALSNISQEDKKNYIKEINESNNTTQVDAVVTKATNFDKFIGDMKPQMQDAKALAEKLDTQNTKADHNALTGTISAIENAFNNAPDDNEMAKIKANFNTALTNGNKDLNTAKEQLTSANEAFKKLNPEIVSQYGVSSQDLETAKQGKISQMDDLINKLNHYVVAAPLFNFQQSEELNSNIPLEPGFKVLKETTKGLFEDVNFNDPQAIATAAAAQGLNNAQIDDLNNVYSFSHLNKGQKEAIYKQIQLASDTNALSEIMNQTNHLDASMSQLSDALETVNADIKDPNKHYEFASQSKLEELKKALATANALENLATGTVYETNQASEIDALREKINRLNDEIAQEAEANYQAAIKLQNSKQQAIEKINALNNISQNDKDNYIKQINEATNIAQLDPIVTSATNFDEFIGEMKPQMQQAKTLLEKLDTQGTKADHDALANTIAAIENAFNNAPDQTGMAKLSQDFTLALANGNKDLTAALEQLTKATQAFEKLDPAIVAQYGVSAQELEATKQGKISAIDALSNKLNHYVVAVPLLNYQQSEELNSNIPLEPGFKVLKETTKGLFENVNFNDPQAIEKAAAAQELNNVQITALNKVYNLARLNKGQKEALYKQIQLASDKNAVNALETQASQLDTSMAQLGAIAQNVNANILDASKHYQYANEAKLQELKDNLATANALENLATGTVYQTNQASEIDALAAKLTQLDANVAQDGEANYQEALKIRQKLQDEINQTINQAKIDINSNQFKNSPTNLQNELTSQLTALEAAKTLPEVLTPEVIQDYRNKIDALQASSKQVALFPSQAYFDANKAQEAEIDNWIAQNLNDVSDSYKAQVKKDFNATNTFAAAKEVKDNALAKQAQVNAELEKIVAQLKDKVAAMSPAPELVQQLEAIKEFIPTAAYNDCANVISQLNNLSTLDKAYQAYIASDTKNATYNTAKSNLTQALNENKALSASTNAKTAALVTAFNTQEANISLLSNKMIELVSAIQSKDQSKFNTLAKDAIFPANVQAFNKLLVDNNYFDIISKNKFTKDDIEKIKAITMNTQFAKAPKVLKSTILTDIKAQADASAFPWWAYLTIISAVCFLAALVLFTKDKK